MIFELDGWGPLVGQGVTGAQYCTMGGVAKRSGPGSELAIVNEFICSRLGLILGLPVPPGVIANDLNGNLVYVSLRFGSAGVAPPPANLNDLVVYEPSTAAGIVVFDCWIANSDRHAGNVAYAHPDLPPAIFDHERALLGTEVLDAEQRLGALAGTAVVSGSLPALITDGTRIVEWCQRIDEVSGEAIRTTCREMRRKGGLNPRLEGVARDFLLARRRQLLPMLRAKMTHITTWGLP